MASGYSQPHDFGKYVSQIPLETIGTALAYRQGKYDQNLAKLQSFMSSFANIDILKPQDKEYFMQNLNFLRSQVEQFGMGDLSQQGTLDRLVGYIGQASDDKVVNAVAGTKAYRKVQSEYDEMRKKHPDKATPGNLAYSLKGLNKWANDGKVGSDWTSSEYGTPNSTYIPYHDVLSVAQDVISKLEPDAYVEFDSMGNFTYYKQSGEKLTEERIIHALDTALQSDPRIAQQMRIDAWVRYDGMTDDQFVEGVQGIYESRVSAYDKSIEKLQRQLISANTTEKAKIETTIEYLTNERKKYIDVAPEDILNKRELLQEQIYKEDFLSGMGDAYAYHKIKDKGFEVNRGALEVWKENNAQRRADAEASLEYDKAKVAVVNAFLKNNSVQEAILTGNAYGIPPEIVQALVTPVTPVVGEITTGRERADFTENMINTRYENSVRELDGQEQLMLDMLQDRTYFGLNNFDNLDQLSQNETFEGIMAMTEDQFNAHKVAGRIGDTYTWADFMEVKNSYQNTLDDYIVSEEIYTEAKKQLHDRVLVDFEGFPLDQKIDELVTNPNRSSSRLSNGELVRFVDTGRPDEVGFLVQGELVEGGWKLFPVRKRADGYDATSLENAKNQLKEYVYETYKPMVRQEIYEDIYTDVLGGQLTPIDINVQDASSGGFVQVMLEQIGLDRINPKMQEALGLSLYDGTIGQRIRKMTNENAVPFQGITVGVTSSGVTIEAGGKSQTFDPSLFSGYVADRFSTIISTLAEEERQQILGSHYLRSVDMNSSRIIPELASHQWNVEPIEFRHNFGTESAPEFQDYSVNITIQYEAVKNATVEGYRPILLLTDSKTGAEVGKTYITTTPIPSLLETKQIVQAQLAGNLSGLIGKIFR